MYEDQRSTPAGYRDAAAEMAARAAGEVDPAARLDYRRRAVARLDIACLLAATPPTQCRRAVAPRATAAAPGVAGKGQGQAAGPGAAGAAAVGSGADAAAPPEKRLAPQSLLPQDLIAMLQDAIKTPKTPRREDRGTAN